MLTRTRHVVVMGVSGCGKTTVANRISASTGLVFAEADDFHSAANVAKMAAGVPLDDDDRWPWLERLAAWMTQRAAAGDSTVIACSALRRRYRDVLGSRSPSGDRLRLDFVHLHGPADVVAQRLSRRTGHYMPGSLLQSQIATLEPLEPDERGVVLDLTRSPVVLAAQAARQLGLTTAAARVTRRHDGGVAPD